MRVNVASTCLFFGRNQWDTRGAKKWKMIGKPSSYGTTWNIFHFRHVLAVGLSRAAQIRLLCKQSTIKLIQPTRNRLSTTSLLPILHTIPLEELIESVERARLEAKLRYVVIYGAACSYCLARAERLDGSYLRTFALELKEQLAQTLTAFVMSILTQPRWESAAEPLLRQIIDVLQQVMCAHDAEKLAISVLEIYKDSSVRQLHGWCFHRVLSAEA